MRRSVWLYLAVIALVAVTLLNGCGRTQQPVAAAPYKIGVVLSITGPNAPLGTVERDVINLLVDQVNGAGGISGHPLQAIIIDDGSDETRAVTAATKLIFEDKVLGLLGSSGSGPALAMAAVAEKNEVPQVALASSIKLVQPVKKWVFKSIYSDIWDVQAIMEFLQSRGITKIGFIHDSNAYGTSGKEQFSRRVGDFGASLVAVESYNSTDSDMTVQLTRIRDAGAQAVVMWGTNPGPAVIVKNMRQLGMKIPVITPGTVATQTFLDLTGPAAEGVYFNNSRLSVVDSLPDSDRQKPVILAFRKAYHDRYGTNPTFFGGIAHDGFQLMVKALNEAGADRGKIRDALERTHDFVGITGIYNMTAQDHEGLNRKDIIIAQYQNGQYILIQN